MEWKLYDGATVKPLCDSVFVLTVRRDPAVPDSVHDDREVVSYCQQNSVGGAIPADLAKLTVAELEAIVAHRQKLGENLIDAADVPGGDFFRKRTGSTPYVRLTESSVRYLKLDGDKVWGVTDYGNVTQVLGHTKVVLLSKPAANYNDEWESDDE